MDMSRILVVEDEPHLQELYRLEFEDAGYDVTTCGDGETAIQLARDHVFDLIILDIKIPKREGTEVLHEVKQRNRDIRVILNSAYATYKNDFSTWLADAYVVKSADLGELRTTVENLLAPQKSG
jgi:DNA-binding response OmpR family regulator